MFNGGLDVDTKFTFEIGEARYGHLTTAGIRNVLKFLSTYVELRSMSISMVGSNGTMVYFTIDHFRLALIAQTRLHYRVIEISIESYTIEQRKMLTSLVIDMINSNCTLVSVSVRGLIFTKTSARSFVNALKNNKKVTMLRLSSIYEKQFSLCAYIIRQCTNVTEFAIGSYDLINIAPAEFCEMIDSIHSNVKKVRINTCITATILTSIIKLVERSSNLNSLACGCANAQINDLVNVVKSSNSIKCIQIFCAWSVTDATHTAMMKLLTNCRLELIDVPNTVIDLNKPIPDNTSVLNLGSWGRVALFTPMICRNNMITHTRIHAVIVDTIIALWNHPITDPYVLAMIIAWINPHYIIRKRFIDETAIAICNSCHQLKSLL